MYLATVATRHYPDLANNTSIVADDIKTPDHISMGPPHRQTQLPTMPHTTSLTTQLPVEHVKLTGGQTPQPSLGMTPASRYNYNLKVLRRRDPSILSIFDQFSHVCVYHHDGKKWEKHGYEGSMFLFERWVFSSKVASAVILTGIPIQRVLPSLWILYYEPRGHG